jgi:hypothetical protein
MTRAINEDAAAFRAFGAMAVADIKGVALTVGALIDTILTLKPAMDQVAAGLTAWGVTSPSSSAPRGRTLRASRH